MNTEEQLAKIYGELEDMIDVQVYSHELRDDLIDASKAVRKARETAYRVLTKGQKDKYGMTIGSSKKPIKSSVRDDFARGLQNIMKEKGAEFADGTLEDNMVDIYDNYVSQYYEEELKEEGGEAVAEDWFRNTYYDDEEGIFIHNSRKPIKSYIDHDVDEENSRYDDDELRSLPPDADDDDYDYGDWESGRPMYSNRKPIKSSLEDRLIPYLEEFEEGYADTINRDAEEGSNGAYEEAFIEGFKNDYNLTDEDIEKLKGAVHNIWNESAEDEIRDMGEMYGVPRGATSEEALKHFE